MNTLTTILKLKNLEQEIRNIKKELEKEDEKEVGKYMKMDVKELRKEQAELIKKECIDFICENIDLWGEKEVGKYEELLRKELEKLSPEDLEIHIKSDYDRVNKRYGAISMPYFWNHHKSTIAIHRYDCGELMDKDGEIVGKSL